MILKNKETGEVITKPMGTELQQEGWFLIHGVKCYVQKLNGVWNYQNKDGWQKLNGVVMGKLNYKKEKCHE